MTTDIFIKTCQHDAAYHTHCLRSIEKFCSGFRGTVVVEGEHPQGYLMQQVVKLHADERTDADFILVTDSDTLFTEPVTPESFMRDGKPIWYMTPFSEEMKASVPWFGVMRDFFGEDPEFELMRRQPFMFPREVLQGFRGFCLAHHDIPIETYIRRAGQFSEWCCLGEYCRQYHNEKFHWINTETDEMPPLLVRQFWSHAPLAENIEEITNILA